MKVHISSLDVTGAYFRDGLGRTVLERLPSTVVFAGPNGSGKSRMLKRIQWVSGSRKNLQKQKDFSQEIAEFEKRILDGDHSDETRHHLEQFILEQKKPSSIQRSDQFNVCVISSDTMQFQSVAEARQHDLTNVATYLNKFQEGVSNSPSNALRIIHKVLMDYAYSESPLVGTTAADKEEAHTRYTKLQKTLKSLLGAQVVIKSRERAEIFGRPLDDLQLSQGQIRLLQLCVTIFNHAAIDDPLVILLDEPENHLHPEAQIQFIDAVRNAAVNSQLFIATHSIPLIAHLGSRNVWVMSEKATSYAGKRAHDVLLSLMGGNDNISALASLLQEPAAIALHQFATECLSPPSIAAFTPGDPQGTQVSEALKGSELENIRVLDYGSGDGRLLLSLRENFEIAAGQQLSQVVSYYSFEPTTIDVSRHESALNQIYGEDSVRHFSLFSALNEHFSHDKLDVVVLCNVLHEIDPLQWIKEFSQIRSVLKPDGCVLVLEDSEIPIGELPNKTGFVILDHRSTALLFDTDPKLIELIEAKQERYSRRIYCLKIPASLLSRLTTETLKSALKWIAKQSRDKIVELRVSDIPSIQQGHRHALLAMQSVNASIAVGELSVES